MEREGSSKGIVQAIEALAIRTTDEEDGSDRHSIDLNRKMVARSLSMEMPHGDRGPGEVSLGSTMGQHNLVNIEGVVASEAGPSADLGVLVVEVSIQLAQFHEWIWDRELASTNSGFLIPQPRRVQK